MSDDPAPPDWIRDFYAAVDANEGETALGRMRSDIVVQFAARPVAVGRDAAAATMAAFHRSFRRVSHRFLNVWTMPDCVICEFSATYELHDGSTLTMPSLTVLRPSGEQVAEMRVYLDESLLLEAPAAAPDDP